MLENKFIFDLQRFEEIENETDNTLVSGTSGDDDILNGGSNVTIAGGAGNDSISVKYYDLENTVIEYNEGDGNDTIFGLNETDTISISGGFYTTQTSGADIIVTVGEGSIKLENVYVTASRININDESIELEPVINLTDGDDSILNRRGDNISINGGAGNDSISNDSDKVTINGGTGNDKIYNYWGFDEEAPWDNGEGKNVLCLYNDGDGDDIIYGFNATSTLSINGGSYSPKKSGSNVVVTVGDGKITLIGAASLSAFNITGTHTNSNNIINLTSNTLVSGSDGNDYIVNGKEFFYEDFEFEDPPEYDPPEGYGGDDDDDEDYDDWYDDDYDEAYDEYEEAYDEAYSKYLEDRLNAYEDYLYESNGNNNTINGCAGNDQIVNYGFNNIIDGGSGNDAIENYASNVTISGGTGDDTISIGNLRDDELEEGFIGIDYEDLGGQNIRFKYEEDDGNDSIVGFNETSTLQIAASSYSTEESGSDIIVTVGEGSITLQGAASLSAVNIESIDGETSWTLNDTTATYGTTNNTLITITGVKSLDGITLDDTTVTIAKSSLGTSKVTISDGYTLKLDSDVTKPSTTKAAWSLKNSTATYKSSSKTAGYTLASDGKSITYSKATTAETLVTVKGVKSIKGLKLSGTTVTVAKSSLNAEKVTISKGYSLKLADDVTKPTTKASWSLKSSTATYNQTTTAGYSLANNEINYTKKATTTLASVKGVKSLDGLSLSKKVVTVSKASLSTSKVTLSGDGYTLKLGSNVTKPTVKNAAWSLKSTTATYKGTATAGYTLASDAKSITYSKKDTTTLATVKGIKSIKGLKVNDKVITVSKASLGTSKVTLSGNGYTLKLGSDVTKSTLKNKAWSLKSSTATYKGTSTAGYSLEENEIIYSKKATKTLATVKGVKSTSGLKVSGMTITVSKASLNAKNVTVSDGYKLALSKDVTKSTAKKATWTLKSSTATYNQQTTAGYSLEDNSIIYSKSATTKTLATVKGAKSKSGISVNDNVITLKNSALSNKVTVSGSYEFDFASDYKKATITGSSSADTITARGSNIKLNGGSGADLLSGGTSNDSINGGAGNDVIYGNKGKDTLVGGKGNDSLWGGAGNDSLYGDAGNDTFIYKPGEGTDTIFNFQTGDLLTILKFNGKEGSTFTSSSFKNGNLTLAIDGGGSVIFNGVSKSNSFNINGDTYKISGSKLTQK